MRLPESFIEEIKYKANIEDVIGGYVNLKRRGRTYVGLCPFHSEKTPSFVVYSETQSFFCFGCGAGGDVFTFIMQIENLDYSEAIKFLCDKYGIQMPEVGIDDSMQKLRLKVLEINKEAGRFFYGCLKQSKIASEYFANRNMPIELIKKFGLGYAPDSWDLLIKHLQGKGYSIADIAAAGLASKSSRGSYYSYFRNRVMFPIIDIRGNVIAFGGRVLGDEKPKYLNSPDTIVYKKTRTLFGMNFAKSSKSDFIILSEGYMDTIAMYKAEFDNVVATCGTALTSEQAMLISKYADDVIIAYDSDAAGIKATDKAIKIFEQAGINAKILHIEDAKDPDEYINKFGAAKFIKLLENSLGSTEYMLKNLEQKYNINTDEGKVRFLKDATILLSEISSPIERDIYIGKLSARLDVSRQAIEETMRRNAKYKRRKESQAGTEKSQSSQILEKINPERKSSKRGISAEDIIIASIVKNPEWVKDLPFNEYATSFGSGVISIIAQNILQSGGFEMSAISGEASREQLSYISCILAKYEGHKFSKEEFTDCIALIEQDNLQKKSADISSMSDEEYKQYLDNIMSKK